MTTPGPNFSRILLTRMKFIGDVVLTTPIIRSIRDAYPDATIAYLGEKNAVSLLEHNPNLDQIIAFDFSRPAILEQPRVLLQLREKKFDLSIDLFNNPRSALLTYLSGAKTRVGAHSRSGRGKLYTVEVRDNGEPKTAIQFHNQFIEAVGIVPTSSKTEIFLTNDEVKEAGENLEQTLSVMNPIDPGKPVIGMHPGATWPAKLWLPERYGELADMIVEKLDAYVVLLAGPNDEDAVRATLGHSRWNIEVLRGLPLRRLAAVIKRCAVFIGNDAGPMHIAAAVGTRTLGLFGPGEDNIWFPYAAGEHIALRKDVPCHPCHLDFCNREGEEYMECMKQLTVKEVFDAAARLVQKT